MTSLGPVNLFGEVMISVSACITLYLHTTLVEGIIMRKMFNFFCRIYGFLVLLAMQVKSVYYDNLLEYLFDFLELLFFQCYDFNTLEIECSQLDVGVSKHQDKCVIEQKINKLPGMEKYWGNCVECGIKTNISLLCGHNVCYICCGPTMNMTSSAKKSRELEVRGFNYEVSDKIESTPIVGYHCPVCCKVSPCSHASVLELSNVDRQFHGPKRGLVPYLDIGKPTNQMLNNRLKRVLVLSEWENYTLPKIYSCGYEREGCFSDTYGDCKMYQDGRVLVSLPPAIVNELNAWWVGRDKKGEIGVANMKISRIYLGELLNEVSFSPNNYLHVIKYVPIVCLLNESHCDVERMLLSQDVGRFPTTWFSYVDIIMRLVAILFLVYSLICLYFEFNVYWNSFDYFVRHDLSALLKHPLEWQQPPVVAIPPCWGDYLHRTFVPIPSPPLYQRFWSWLGSTYYQDYDPERHTYLPW